MWLNESWVRYERPSVSGSVRLYHGTVGGYERMVVMRYGVDCVLVVE
jgi:hypothetical protein